MLRWIALLYFALLSAPCDAQKPLEPQIPVKVRSLPEGSGEPGSSPAFPFRGIKGWAWLPEQYLAEIPFLAKYRMNFLMNCYSSLWDLGEGGRWVTGRPMNHWYKPLPDGRKRGFEAVARACRRNGVEFCFSVNPNLMSDHPFDYGSTQDLEDLWRHYAWMQGLGVRWFNVSLDDISQRIEAEGQVQLVNEIFRRLRIRDPQAQMIFCPTWYAGTGESGEESSQKLGSGDTAGQRYTRVVAENLNPEIYLFWTGSDVCPLRITAAEARKYRALVRHRLFLWDNYPVNDQHPALHLGPLTGRDGSLAEVIDGYMGNAMSFENEADRIPRLTMADYAWNPEGYDPLRSIGQAIAHLGATAAQRQALRDLVELYPGRLWDGSTRTDWNSLRERFRRLLASGSSADARALLGRARDTSQRLAAAFPDGFAATRHVLESDIRAIQDQIQ